MSASREKKLRQDQTASGYVDPKAEKELEEKKAEKRSNVLYSVIAVLFVLVVAASFLWRSNVISRNATALTIDGETYNAAEVNFYYQNVYRGFLQSNSYFISYLGLDTNASLKSQTVNATAASMMGVEEGSSWHDYIMDNTVKQMTMVQRGLKQAQEEGYQFPASVQEQYEDSLNSLKTSAESTGMSVKAYLQRNLGAIMTEKVYNQQVLRMLQYQAYAQSYSDSLTYTDAELEAAYQADPKAYDKAAWEYVVVSGAADSTTDADGNTVSGIANVIGAGFSGTFSSIGIVIIFGALVGTLLESTGAALKMADCVVKLVGEKHPEIAIELMGWIVSIPVFCDSGFVVLNPIRKAMTRRTGTSSVAMSVALSMGLYISHCFIPPTPGPIAAAGTLGCGDNLLLVMGLGALCSIPPLVAGYFFAKYIGKKVKAADDIVADGDVKTYEQLVAEFGKLPSGWLAFAPIVLPIILMGLASAFSMAGVKADFISFLGTPIIALAVGCIIAIISLFAANKGKDFYKLTDDTLKTVGPILFVTAAGGVLGKVIASSDMVNFIKANAEIFESIGIFFPFLLAAILKSAQGSSTVAITTTAGIVAPLLPVLGLDSPALSCLTVIAIGAGAMTVSHANDSYFWVVTNFGEMTPQDGYKTQTLGTLVIGVVSIIGVFIVSLFLH